MQVCEVNVRNVRNVLRIGVGTAVAQYSGTGHTGVMTGGVRFGLCTEEEREVMKTRG